MATVGVFFSTEELQAPQIIELAPKAEAAGFTKGWISDHFHPWNNAQGSSPLVWSVLGGLAAVTEEIGWHTAVTCPTVRIHPAIIAQAAATVATMMPGRFGLGLGSGEALNEHIFGDQWPTANVRLEMLEEAVALIRELWTGEITSHDGEHYHVEHARLYSLPDELPSIHVSGFGPKATELAARIGDGYMNVGPEAELVQLYRDSGGTGTAHMGQKVCVGPDKQQCAETMHRLWPNDGLPGELAQLLPTPEHFEQAAELVTVEMMAESTPHGPDPQGVVDAIQAGFDAGFDEVYVSQIGPDQDFFLNLMEQDVLPHFKG